MVSDRGPQFSSQFWKAFCTLIGSFASLSSGFHPQTNGQSARANQELETNLRCLVSTNPTTWSCQLVWVEYARNTLPCSATGLSPFECPWGISLHSSLNKSRRSAYPQPRCLSAGEEPGRLFSRPTPGIVNKWTVAGPQLPATALGTGYGFQLVTCPCG